MNLKTSTIVLFSSLAVVAGLFGAFLFLNFAPFDWIAHENQAFGTTITTINGTDRITDSRTTINNNFSSLNTNKFELSDWYATTSAAQLTTLANLATVGTITSGTWSGTAVAATKGGTGQTTVTAGDLLYGSASNVWSKLAKGSDGQFLTLSSGLPAWTASAINQAASYTWTGLHNFAGASTRIAALIASSTISVDNGGSATSWTLPTGTHASSTIWMFNASGAGFERYPQARPLELKSNASVTTSNTSTTSLETVVIPANTLVGTYKHTRVTSIWKLSATNGNPCWAEISFGDGSSSSTVAFGKVDGLGGTTFVTADIFATSTTAQMSFGRGMRANNSTVFAAPTDHVVGTRFLAADLSAQSYFSFDGSCTASNTVKLVGYDIEIISK